MMCEFQCNYLYDDGGRKIWTGQWELLETGLDHVEFLISGRSSQFRVITGHCPTGNFLCIPLENIGCPLASWSDLFWNTEQLSRILNITDAVTIATALLDYQQSFF